LNQTKGVDVSPEHLFTTEQIAMIAHEVNRIYCATIREVMPPWYDADDWQRDSVIDGVRKHLAEGATPEQSHARWMERKAAEGWVWGEKKDSSLRTHPCMKPYNELPESQRRKDQLFIAVVEFASKL